MFHSGYLSIKSCKEDICTLRFSNNELEKERVSDIIYDRKRGNVPIDKNQKSSIIAFNVHPLHFVIFKFF